MTWYAIHDTDGILVSIGTVLADPMPDGLTAVALSDEDAEQLTHGGGWDTDTRTVIAAPVDIDPAHMVDDPVAVVVAGLQAEVRALTAALDNAKVIDADAVKAAASGSKDDDALVLAVAKHLDADPNEVRKKRDENPQWFADVVEKYGLGRDPKADSTGWKRVT